MQEELPRSARVMVELIRFAIFGDICANQPNLSPSDPSVGLR